MVQMEMDTVAWTFTRQDEASWQCWPASPSPPGKWVFPAEQHPPEQERQVPKRCLHGGVRWHSTTTLSFQTLDIQTAWSWQLSSMWAGPLLFKQFKSKIRCIHTYSCQYFPNWAVKLKPENCIKKTKTDHWPCFGSILMGHPLLKERQERKVTEDETQAWQVEKTQEKELSLISKLHLAGAFSEMLKPGPCAELAVLTNVGCGVQRHPCQQLSPQADLLLVCSKAEKKMFEL